MDKKERRPHLGRGLESLIGPSAQLVAEAAADLAVAAGVAVSGDAHMEAAAAQAQGPPSAAGAAAGSAVTGAAQEIPLSEIDANPYQPRASWNEQALRDLAESVRVHGIIQPIVVRKHQNRYQVVAGERRARAAHMAGLKTIPAVVREVDDRQTLELALVENIHREDLNPLERAEAYQDFMGRFGLTQTEAAARLGEDRTAVANYLRLLDLPGEVQMMLARGELTMGHARALLALASDELRRKVANRALTQRLSVRDVERLVNAMVEAGRERAPTAAPRDPNVVDLERRMQESLGTRVQIQARRRSHSGRIVIDYYSLDEFERLAARMGVDVAEAGG